MIPTVAVKQPRFRPDSSPVISKILIPALFLSTLSGCASAFSVSAMRDSDARAAAVYADCTAQLRNGLLKSHRQAADCAKPRVLAAYQENGYPFMDLVQLDLAARAAGADRIDTGFAQEVDVDRDITELDRRILAERERRMAVANATGGNPASAPAGQLLAGLDAITDRAAGKPGSACFQIGSFNHCD
jgi:hypothetical protein